jgi:predicted nucleic acid-binding protein
MSNNAAKGLKELRAVFDSYDAYFLDCAIRRKAPLLTLDRSLKMAAQTMNIKTLEV